MSKPLFTCPVGTFDDDELENRLLNAILNRSIVDEIIKLIKHEDFERVTPERIASGLGAFAIHKHTFRKWLLYNNLTLVRGPLPPEPKPKPTTPPSPTDRLTPIDRRLIVLRLHQEVGLNHQKIAEVVGLSRQQVSKILQGKTR